MKTVNKNFIYNIIYQLFTFLVPIISVPYISRVLGPDNIGIYSYTYSIVYYFMLAGMLGINNYGARSIAKCKDDFEKRSEEFCSIYSLQLILTIIMLVAFSIMSIFFFNEYRPIMFIQSIYLISVVFDINWLFFGLEKFKITISRNVIIKILSLLLIFIFVKNGSDLWKYILIMSGSTLLSQLYLWLHIRKYIKIVKVSAKSIIKHIKKCIILFIPVIAYSIYRVMDRTMIGAIINTEELGYYENAEKIISIPISFITALGTVMMPYMSKNDNNTKDEFNKKIESTFELCFFCIMPMCFGLISIARIFSNVFFGESFYKSGTIIMILSISIIFSAVANVIRTSYLIPKEKDSIYIKSTIVGAILNLIANIILIPKFASYGACIGTIIAEFSVMFYQMISVRHEINFKKVFGYFIKYTFLSLIMSIIIFAFRFFYSGSELIELIIEIILSIVFYTLINYKYLIYDFLNIKKKK